MGSLTWIPVGLIGILSWSVWFIRRYLSHHHYRETVNDFRCTTSRDADGMVWMGNVFADNEQYGLDPHDFSSNFIVAGSVLSQRKTRVHLLQRLYAQSSGGEYRVRQRRARLHDR